MVPNLLQTSGLMNPARCAGLAKDGGYTVFAIQNSVECRAGNDVARAQSLGTSTACTMACHNAPTGDCGGNLANAVYVVGSNTPPAAPTASKGYTSVGCYKDNIADRALPRLLATDVGMTVDKCAALARKEGGHASRSKSLEAQSLAQPLFAVVQQLGTSVCNVQKWFSSCMPQWLGFVSGKDFATLCSAVYLAGLTVFGVQWGQSCYAGKEQA